MDSMCVYTLKHINGALNFPVLYQSATEAMVDNNCYVYNVYRPRPICVYV